MGAPQILTQQIRHIMEQSFIDYAMSVITDRALPDVRDGLKPVHRRILFAMHEAGNDWNKGYKKSARMVGDVIGKYHPHGDSSVYDAAVRMAQPFSMRHVLIDGQGNFGSVDGDSPAAMRYTEMRLSRLAGEMFGDLHKETVDFRPNYDGNEKEPTVLTAPYPNLLVNGVEGIAVGMATSIPPHNLRAVIDATCALIDDPETDAAAIIKLLQAPDFPTGGIVHGLGGFADAVTKGRGKIMLRSKWHTEERGRGASTIILDELPYQVNKANLVAKIAQLVRDKEIEDIVGLRDESNKEGIRVVIELRAGTSPEVIFAQLVAKTDVQVSFNYNCVVLDGGKPCQMGLADMLRGWLAFREDVVLKRYIYERKQAQARLHILEGLMAAIGMLDKVIALIRAAENPAAAKTGLMDLLSIDEAQAQAILDLKLQKLTGLELEALSKEHQEFVAKVAALTELIESPEKIRGVIRDELQDIAKRYGDDRRTEIGSGIADVAHEDLIEREDVLITMTRGGYIKRIPASALSAQGRGTRGRRLMDAGDEDTVSAIFHCHSHDQLMVFAQSGQVYAGKAYKIPEGSITAKGRHIRNVIEGLDEEIAAMLALPEVAADLSIVTVTALGQVKRTAVDDYAGASRRGGIKGVTLDDGDKLVGVFACRPHDHLMLVSSTGQCIRFDIEDVRVMGRTAGGVRGMRLDGNARVVGAYVVAGNGEAPPVKVIQTEVDGEIKPVETLDTAAMDEGKFLVCVGQQGVGKRTGVGEFPVQGRGGKGVVAMKLSHKTGDLVAALGATLDQDLVMFASNGVSNRVSVESVRGTGRAASGVILMNLDKEQSVVSVALAMREDGSSEETN
jgi:DNA gyrase subunit A